MRPVYLIAILSLVWSADGQSPSSRFAVSGTVQDPTRAAVPGASVVLRKTGDTVQRTATDDIAAGNYEIEVQHDDFNPEVSRVRVGSRAPAPLTIVLSVATLHHGVTVDEQTSQISTETSENLNAVTVNQQALGEPAGFDQDYVTTMSRFLDAGSIGTGGVTLVVDGLESTRIHSGGERHSRGKD
jgi:hypothetical protein